ncbi:glycosyl hydrolase 115 family protein [Hufsiella ginkgonis]|uniref:Glycosyl hydrolase n=1 Tax=Hufsiella ginkgonis TaxID=2695274 RepID=A0A7K1Y0A4_9SPHI|nr:glycosyl hydrolase 115 family protein [Hufsiella ginkgonis]MXV16711.1 glycosyl hydrolase [Hufsiella ginkgonis]
MILRRLIKTAVSCLVLPAAIVLPSIARPGTIGVSGQPSAGAFPIAGKGLSASIYVDAGDFDGVKRAAADFAADIKKVSGGEATMISVPKGKTLILAGTLGKNRMIDSLIAAGKISVKDIAGTWENCLVQVVSNPFPGTEKALVIAGSDKRGTIYGLYTLSEQIGVSPWNWWADVPVKKQPGIFVNARRWILGSPAVKYRGIFLNDEAPALSGWTKDNFGGFKHEFYGKLFELILRLKGNYLWPAMWGNAFYDDDPENARLADLYGVVIGTSHHEPLMRAHVEWKRYGSGAWNYDDNAAGLAKFWTGGVKRMGNNESIVTIGMRGDGDEPMSKNANLQLLERIVDDQRKIIADVTGKPASAQPQAWALYKEVQEYYDKGMRVPDDVTLLLCDDNWGAIRKLPALDAKPRGGGYGIYYHFDYVGGPRNYKWINTNPLPRIWEQMNLAYRYNARQIWIVNVGDLKPMEFPVSFFLDYAWNPESINRDQLRQYTRSWAAKQFGGKYAEDIADLLTRYAKYNSRRKPELLNERTYSLVQSREFEQVAGDYRSLYNKAVSLKKQLPKEYHDAYYQLVLHPVAASFNLNALYLATARNQLYASQKRASANEQALLARKLFARDAEISKFYNDTLANGKWRHMMDQTHIGYFTWQEPKMNTIPRLAEITPGDTPELGVSIEGSAKTWPAGEAAVLPGFNRFSQRSYYLELFNRGRGALSFTANASSPWVKIDKKSGTLGRDQRIMVSIDWKKVPSGDQQAKILVKGSDNTALEIAVRVEDFGKNVKGFVPDNGLISIDAGSFSTRSRGMIQWELLPDHGRTGSAVCPLPAAVKTQDPLRADCPYLEYSFFSGKGDSIQVNWYLSPSLDFRNAGGLRFAVSVDGEPPHTVNINKNETEGTWEKHAGDNINIQQSRHWLKAPGNHKVKVFMVDPGIVLQKLVILESKAIDATYLGAPQSVQIN